MNFCTARRTFASKPFFQNVARDPGITSQITHNVAIHNDQIMKDSRIYLEEQAAKKYHLIAHVPETTKLELILGHCSRFVHGHRYINRYLSQATSRGSDEDLLSDFLIDKEDMAATYHFLFLHTWMIQSKLQSLKLKRTDALVLIELINLVKFSLASVGGIKDRHLPVGRMLKEFDKERRTFYEELDGCLNRPQFAGWLRYVLWKRLYNGEPEHENGYHVHMLTVYLLRMRMFMKTLPREIFMDSEWMWPEWPPGERKAKVGTRYSAMPQDV